MSTIHVINSPVGGAWEIVRRLVERGDKYVLTSPECFRLILKSKPEVCFHFHQPKSHLFCLFLTLLGKNSAGKFTCVLHESSGYTGGVASKCRSKCGHALRWIVINALRIFNVEIVGVSKYVLHSYNIFNGKKISYLGLFREDLDAILCGHLLKRPSTLAVVWIRRGDFLRVTQWIEVLNRRSLVSEVYLFGDSVEVGRVKDYLADRYKDISIAKCNNRIERSAFLKILAKSTWFISVFDKEGFGLSAFEALCSGCICLLPRAGAIPEWLPACNFHIADCLLETNVDIKLSYLKKVSRYNRILAKEILKNES